MSNTLEKGVCDNHKSKNKGVRDHCGVCRCYDAPPVCIFKKKPLVTKIKAGTDLSHKVHKKINQTSQKMNRRKEN